MKKFIINSTIVILLTIITIFAIAKIFSLHYDHRVYKNWETESNLLVMEPNTHYNLIFIGNSHARMFSRAKEEHLGIEKILNKKILNLGRSGAYVGLNEYLPYFKYALSIGITTDTVIFMLATPWIYDCQVNKSTSSFRDEPFRFKFFFQYLGYKDAQNKYLRLYYYMKTKFRYNWTSKFNQEVLKRHLKKKMTEKQLKANFEKTFPTGRDTNNYVHNTYIIENFVKFANQNNIKVIFISTPTLFGHWPYFDGLYRFMDYLKQKYDVEYYDFSEAIDDPYYFYDQHHLNIDGILFFTENYLKKIL